MKITHCADKRQTYDEKYLTITGIVKNKQNVHSTDELHVAIAAVFFQKYCRAEVS